MCVSVFIALSSALRQPLDGGHRFVHQPASVIASSGDGVGHAVAPAIVERPHRHALLPLGGRCDLRGEVDAVLVVLDHCGRCHAPAARCAATGPAGLASSSRLACSRAVRRSLDGETVFDPVLLASLEDPNIGVAAILELAITSPDVTKAFAPNARFPFALYRMEGKSPRKYLAWSPTRTKTPNFHVPEAFGALVLDP